MGLKNGCYATFWESKPTSRGGEMVNISTSRQNKKTQEWVTDFSGNCFLGQGADSMANVPRKTRIVIDEVELRRSYDKEKRIENWNVLIWKWHVAEPFDTTQASRQSAASARIPAPAPVEDPNDLPF